jgi:hypothetical protein
MEKGQAKNDTQITSQERNYSFNENLRPNLNLCNSSRRYTWLWYTWLCVFLINMILSTLALVIFRVETSPSSLSSLSYHTWSPSFPLHSTKIFSISVIYSMCISVAAVRNIGIAKYFSIYYESPRHLHIYYENLRNSFGTV